MSATADVHSLTRKPRRSRVAWIAAFAIACGIAMGLDVPRLLGPLKGDEATFIAMALSVAHDGDLKYRREDFSRFVRLYGTGPEGVFLKQSNQLHVQLHAGWPPI